MNCFDCLLVAWKIGISPYSTLVNTMLQDALKKLSPDEKPIVHSDRGAHYRWTNTIGNWGQIYGELSIMYEGRLPE